MEIVETRTVRGDGGTNVVLLLPRHRAVDDHRLQLVTAQGMRPERDGGTGLENLPRLLDGDERPARRIHHQRVEEHDSGTPVPGFHLVRGPVERQPRPPPQTPVVRTAVRTNSVRHNEHSVLCFLARVPHHHRYLTIRDRVDHWVVPLFSHRRVRVPGRRDRRGQPHHEDRVRVGHPAAGRHCGRPVRRLLER